MARLHPLERAVRDALRRQGLEGATLVVAVSGGPDSMALLHCLHTLRQSIDLSLHVAHFNHNHRGQEAEEDSRLVAQQADALRLAFTTERANPEAYQAQRRISSFEAAARQLRYQFLGRVSASTGSAGVVLGHTADDQAETVLMHILRGSSLEGVGGMAELWHRPPSEGAPAMVLFRPFLGSTKAQTRAYCLEKGIAFRDDSGNLDPRYTRNRVRHQLMPMLEGFNPGVRDALLRLSRTARREGDFLEGEAVSAFIRMARVTSNSIEIDRQSMASLHPALQRRVLRQAYVTLVGDARRLEEAHIEAMTVLLGAGAGKSLSLPWGLVLRVEPEALVMASGEEPSCPLPPLQGEHVIAIPGVQGQSLITRVGEWKVTAWREVCPVDLTQGHPFTAYLDPAIAKDTISVRARRAGDRFHPLGMGNEKRLQDFYVDQKVPRHWRDSIPLVLTQRGIAWVVGYRVAHWARLNQHGQEAIGLTFTLGDSEE